MSTAVAKKQSSAVSKIDFGIDENYTGLQVEQNDIQIPRIQLLQKGIEWEELNDVAWKPGDFFNSLSGKVIKDGFEAVIVDMKKTTKMHGPADKFNKREVIKFSPDGKYWEDGTMITAEDRHSNDKNDFLNGTAVDLYHYIILLKNEDSPFVITFKGASAQQAKVMNTALQYQTPLWRCWVKFSAIEAVNKGGDKYKKLVGKVQPKKMLEDQDIANKALELYNLSQSQRVVSDEMKPDTETDPTY